MDLDLLLKDVYADVKRIYGEELVKLILYGSYARGDYHEYSDIDILALVKCDDKKVMREFYRPLISALSRLDEKHSAYISVRTQNIDYFNRYKDSMPYFKNVVKDGIEVSV